jgi:hypothetical protein
MRAPRIVNVLICGIILCIRLYIQKKQYHMYIVYTIHIELNRQRRRRFGLNWLLYIQFSLRLPIRLYVQNVHVHCTVQQKHTQYATLISFARPKHIRMVLS